MSDFKTVEVSDPVKDPINIMKREDVARMRTSLIACSIENPTATKHAIQQITVLRIYHQVARIVKYLELMDKLEDKLYSSIECTINNAADANPSTWMMLLNIQEKLQKNLLESHKLLQPYLDLEEFSITDLLPAEQSIPTNQLMPPESRERIRNTAQAVLAQLDVGDIDGTD